MLSTHDHLPLPAAGSPSVSIARPPSPTTWEPRVLVVDDDEICRIVATGLLRSLGFTVEVASDGREALEMAAHWSYVAIFMDCSMPDLDGYSAARRLRQADKHGSRTLVIATTSKPRSVSIASGIDYHISKPLQMAGLRADCEQLALLGHDRARISGSFVRPGAGSPLLNPSIFPESATTALRVRPAAAAAAFINEAITRLPELWRSANAGDALSLARVAGTLTETATKLGLQRVLEICAHLSKTGADDAELQPADVEPPLWRALAETSAALTAYVDGGPVTAGPIRESANPAVSDYSPTRVLLADDDLFARVAISNMLDSVDWLKLVGAAAGVDEAVQLAATETPDVVVLDWLMPSGGGAEATRRILECSPSMPIVVLASFVSDDVRSEMTSAGAGYSVVKGGTSEQLTDTIARAHRAARLAQSQTPTESASIGSGTLSTNGAGTLSTNGAGTLSTNGAGTLSPNGAGRQVPSPTEASPRPAAASRSVLRNRNPSPAGSPLDQAGVQRLLSDYGANGILSDLVDLFGTETPARLHEMRTANDAGDAETISASAHHLKGGCVTLAALRMAAICDELESASGHGSARRISKLIDGLELDFTLAHAALRALVSVQED